MKYRFAIIGCGKVGTALGKHLTDAGYTPVGFFSRSMESAKRLEKAVSGEGICFGTPWEAAKHADIIFITTPDHAIEETCRIIVKNRGIRKNAVVLHCSGALPSTILSSVHASHAAAGSMHPLQSFAAENSKNPFQDIMVAVEGDEDAIQMAEAIACDLSAQPFIIRTDGKTLYHAAAVVASNYLVTLMDLSFKLIAASGVSESDAYNVLKPLIKGTLSNIANVGIPDALTGPIARGDAEIVEKHMAAIRLLSPDLLAQYRMLGFATIKIAQAKGTLSEEGAKKMSAILA